MCISTKNGGWLNWLILDPTMGFISNRRYKEAKEKDQQAINSANQAADEQIKLNKTANSTQTTEDSTVATDTTKKIATQRVPLNTSLTGISTGSPTSVGLNLGGY
jgi:hypothetical protein